VLLPQVIKCELFDQAIDVAVKQYVKMLVATPQQTAMLGPLMT
jgi:hypothetical protein